MKNKELIESLLDKVVSQTASEEELSELAVLIQSDTSGSVALQIDSYLQNKGLSEGSLPDREQSEKMIDKILQADKAPRQGKTRIFRIERWIAAAVAIIFVISVAVYFGIPNRAKTNLSKEQNAFQTKNDIEPGGARALLTLADGSRIVLDSAAKGTISRQGASTVMKLADGKLAYAQSGAQTTEILYNTVSTPRGGQYQVTLPDGTKIWLNAASSLRFPTAFTGGERMVELIGEGYFEVAKNAAMPFLVKLGNATVQVLGTHFNIMAYSDEPELKTTLLEGSVKIKSERGSEGEKTLKPGEQAVISGDNHLTILKNADVEQATAWKNGYFQFNKIDQEAMREISRWYDIDIAYDKEMKEKEYTGKIARNVKLSNIVEALKIIGIHCKIENRTLTVMSENSR